MKKVPALLAVLAVAAIATAVVLPRVHAGAQPSAAGGPFTLARLRGQVGLVNVWATWCPPCRREIPTLLTLADQYEARGVRFVAVNADDGDRATVDAFVNNAPPSLKQHLAFPREGFLDSIGIEGLPTTLVVDPEGHVLKRFLGEIHPEEVRAALDAALAQAGKPVTR